MKVELTTDPEGRFVGPLLTLDVPTNERGYVEEGDLGLSGGNLYIVIDGKEYGSLFFMQEDGKPTVTLGQYDERYMCWVEHNPITDPMKYDTES